MQILWHFPQTVTNSFKPKYDNIKWRNNKTEFGLWCKGKTGYPLVDAGMRELNATGFMHNRVRMLVGSFLCKHLLIDWRLGEAYFAEKLHDFERSSNVSNGQWVAGWGVDAAPYFRIFNPFSQGEKFDPNGEYVPDLLAPKGPLQEAEQTHLILPRVGVSFPMWDMPGTVFGLGFALHETLQPGEPAGAKNEYHWGGMAGTHTWMAPEAGITGMCSTQRMPGFWHPFSHEFKALAYQIAG